jgi:serine/threonine protein phosphatase PrpC
VLSLLVLNDSLIAINLGDSRCLISKNNCRDVTELTEPHSPDRIEELGRLLNLGACLIRTKISGGSGQASQQIARSFLDLKAHHKKEKEDRNCRYGNWLLNGRYRASRMLGFPDEKCGKTGEELLSKEPKIFDTDLEEADFAFLGSELTSSPDFFLSIKHRDHQRCTGSHKESEGAVRQREGTAGPAQRPPFHSHSSEI